MAFPTTVVLDSFKTAEFPLSDEGNWKAFFPAGVHMGYVAHEEWETIIASRQEGAYWSPEEFTEPGVALQFSHKVTDDKYWKLWACVAAPTSALIDGYVCKLKQ